MRKIVTLVRDGQVKQFTENVARHARNNGWIEYTEPPAEPTESLTDLKARINAMTSLEDINRALDAELTREAPRESVIKLCNKLIAEWS